MEPVHGAGAVARELAKCERLGIQFLVSAGTLFGSSSMPGIMKVVDFHATSPAAIASFPRHFCTTAFRARRQTPKTLLTL